MTEHQTLVGPVPRRRVKVIGAAVFSSLLLLGCGKGGVTNDSTTSSVAVIDPNVSTTTSLPVAPTNYVEAAAAFKSLATSKRADDYTVDVSHSECGIFAMMIVREKLSFHRWTGSAWIDVSATLNNGLGTHAAKVYSRDFTLDGVTDFFVTYSDEQRRGRKLYGGYFAFPWSGPDRCVWGWLSIDDGRGGAITVNNPEVPSRGTTVFGNGYKHRRLVRGTYKYSFSSNAFIFEPFAAQQ